MKHASAIALAAIVLAAAATTGCRQRDIRTTVIRVPQATSEADRSAIKAELAKIDGIDVEHAVFTNGTLTIDYDSMKLGIKNIEHAIKDIGYDANDFKGEPKKSK